MLNLIKSLLILGCLLASQASFALVDAQILFGGRTVNTTLRDSTSDNMVMEMRFAAHIDPIPFIPVALGVSYGVLTGSASTYFSLITDNDFRINNTEANDLTVELMAWSPVSLVGITPYLKAGYVVYGNYEIDGYYYLADQEIGMDLAYDTSGYLISLGLRWNPIRVLGLLFEMQYASYDLSFDKLTQDSNTGLVSVPASTTSWTWMFGLQVGI